MVAAAAKIKQPSPKPAVPGFIDDSEECEKILVKGSKKSVEVYRITLPPLSYWLELGKVKQCPTVHPPYVSLGFTYVRKDGIAAREQGDFDLVCANCFEGLKSPKSGHTSITDHFDCDKRNCRNEWAVKIKVSSGPDRRARPVGFDGTGFTFDQKMSLHMDAALTFFKIGLLPFELLDNPHYIAHIQNVSRGAWVPPSSQFMATDRPVMSLAVEGLRAKMNALLDAGRKWFKGVAFTHLTFDVCTSRRGFPYISSNLTMLTPWRRTRCAVGEPFEGPARADFALALIHLTGSHSGERTAPAVADVLVPYGVTPTEVVLPVDGYRQMTNISALVASTVTDSGGGVPAACRRLSGGRTARATCTPSVRCWSACLGCGRRTHPAASFPSLL